ncbi:hypothetical protein MYF49_002734 [Enterococcus faecium]|nr:hypothetical protein [Enterococcus faecium]
MEEQKIGAPIRKFDKVYYTEQYETNMTRDDLLRKVLDEYIKQNVTQEYGEDLFNDVVKELDSLY